MAGLTEAAAVDGPGKWSPEKDSFLREAFALRGSVTLQIWRHIVLFTLIAVVVCAMNDLIHPELGVEVAPYEVAGAALGLLLVLRTNAGYDRWWEARKLWGGIVNQSRNLALNAIAHGPDDAAWRGEFVAWTAAYAHVTRRGLRGEREVPEVAELLGEAEARRVSEARHMPSYVALRIDRMLRRAVEERGMDRFGFLVCQESRNRLMDHTGGCERIRKSPLPKVYGINIRRFIFVFLVTLPFALLYRIGWLTPLALLLVAYPILALDQIGVELQNPFNVKHLGHLALDEFCAMIEADVKALAGVPDFREAADAVKVDGDGAG